MTPIDTVKQVVSKRYGVTEAQLCLKARGPEEWQWARRVALWICFRQEFGTAEAIGLEFNRKHNDVIYAFNRVHSDIHTYPFLKKEVDEVLNLVVTQLGSVSV